MFTSSVAYLDFAPEFSEYDNKSLTFTDFSQTIVLIDVTKESLIAFNTLVEVIPNAEILYGTQLREFSEISKIKTNNLIIIGHGTQDGLMFNNQIISWQKIAFLYQEVQSDNIFTISCYSASIEEFTTRSGIYGYEGLVDAKLAALSTLAAISYFNQIDDKIFTNTWLSMMSRFQELQAGAVPNYMVWVPLLESIYISGKGTQYLWLDISTSRFVFGISSSQLPIITQECFWIPYRTICYPVVINPYVHSRNGISGTNWKLMNYGDSEHTFNSDLGHAIQYLSCGIPLIGNCGISNYINNAGSWDRGYLMPGAFMLAVLVALGLLTGLELLGLGTAIIAIINTALGYAADYSDEVADFLVSSEWIQFGGAILNFLGPGSLLVTSYVVIKSL